MDVVAVIFALAAFIISAIIFEIIHDDVTEIRMRLKRLETIFKVQQGLPEDTMLLGVEGNKIRILLPHEKEINGKIYTHEDKFVDIK